MEHEAKFLDESFLQDAIRKSGLPTPKTWCKYTNKRIKTLHPLIRWHFATAINNCEKRNVYVRLTDATRTIDEQNRLYGHGRIADALIQKGINPEYAQPKLGWKTNAVGGSSYHNYSLAGDVCEIRKQKPLWGSADWDIISKEFKQLGFTWLFDIMGKDKPHFQITFGHNIADLKELYKQKKFDEKGFLILT